MDASTKRDDNIKKIAGFLALLQAVAWIIMTIICIIIYHRDYILSPPGTSYMDGVNWLMYYLFLCDSCFRFSGQKMTPQAFNGFMYAYLVLNLIWVAISVTVLSKTHNRLASVLKLWCSVTALMCMVDLIFVIMLGVDYDVCLHAEQSYLEEENCANGILPVLTIGARGFILWIINVIFAILLIKMVRNSNKPIQQSHIQEVQPYQFQHAGILSQHPRYQAQFQPNELSSYEQYPQSPVAMSPVPQSANNYGRVPYPYESNQYQPTFVLANPPKRFQS